MSQIQIITARMAEENLEVSRNPKVFWRFSLGWLHHKQDDLKQTHGISLDNHLFPMIDKLFEIIIYLL